MPDWIQNPAKLEKKLANLTDRGASHSLVLSVSFLPGERYNKDYSELASQLRTLHQGRENVAFK